MLTYVQYKNAVLLELQDQMTAKQYDESIMNRLSVIESIIMEQHDRPGVDKPSPKMVASQIVEEFSIK